MANPKRRHSNTRTRLRRAHDALATPKSVSACPQCGGAVLPYRVCPSCGSYRGRQVLTIKTKSAEEKK